jgi:AbrB family looped-hinge helix DNA binding protein
MAMIKYETGKLSAKGQTVIPLKMRELLGIGEGDRLQFIIKEDSVEVVGVKRKSILDSVGVIKSDKKLDNLDVIRDQVRKDMVQGEDK